MIAWATTQSDWVLGFQDECWWSRVTDPNLHAWSPSEAPLRLRDKHGAVPKGEAKALACYGLWLPEPARILLRFVTGRPVSAMTIEYLEWVSTTLHQDGKTVLLMVWDNASWHISQAVRQWLREHGRAVKQGKKEGVRLVVCRLPSRARG